MAKSESNPDGHQAASDFIRDTYNHLVATGQVRLSVDNLPYTEHFERIYVRVNPRHPMTRNEVHRRLMNLRKRGECQAPPREAS